MAFKNYFTIDTERDNCSQFVPIYYQNGRDLISDYLNEDGADLDQLKRDIAGALCYIYGPQKINPTPHEIGKAVRQSGLFFCYTADIIAVRYGEQSRQHFEDYDTEKEEEEWTDNFALAFLDVLRENGQEPREYWGQVEQDGEEIKTLYFKSSASLEEVKKSLQILFAPASVYVIEWGRWTTPAPEDWAAFETEHRTNYGSLY